MKRTILLLAAVALTLGRLGAEEGQGKSVSLDIGYLKSLDDLPMVAVTVNGQDGTFLIDTGQVAEGTTLTPAFARKCGITTQESTATLAVGKGKEAIELKNLDVLVLNRGVERDGILGYTFFEKVRTTMDYPGNKVTFSTYDFEQKPPEGAIRAPMEFLKTSRRTVKGPYVKAKVGNGKEVWLCLDTGANWSSINTDVFDTVFTATRKQTIFGKSYTVGTTSVAWGGFEFPSADFVRQTNQGLIMTHKITGTPVAGLIGTNIMKAYIVTFDYDKKEFIFVKPGKK